MRKSIIAVDIDSTLYPFIDLWRKVAKSDFNVTFPTVMHWGQCITSFESFDDAMESIKICHSNENIREAAPYKNAARALIELMYEDFDIWYYTDRDEKTERATRFWLAVNNFPVPSNLVICKDKRDDLKRVRNELFTLIDDRPRTLIHGLHNLNLTNVYSIQHTYNENLKDIPGVNIFDDWLEMGEVIKCSK